MMITLRQIPNSSSLISKPSSLFSFLYSFKETAKKIKNKIFLHFMDAFFLELSVIMMLVLGVCFLMHLIRQPLIIAYILVGIIAGPLFFNILSETQSYQLFSHIGVSFLLFIVGLHLNFKLIKEVGVVSLITGIGQVLFTSLIGFFLCRLLGFSFIAATITAIAITFSSTIIIVKLLSDKHDLDKLYGKISLGFLLVQDFIAVFILMIVGATLSIKEGVRIQPFCKLFY